MTWHRVGSMITSILYILNSLHLNSPYFLFYVYPCVCICVCLRFGNSGGHPPKIAENIFLELHITHEVTTVVSAHQLITYSFHYHRSRVGIRLKACEKVASNLLLIDGLIQVLC